MWQKSHMLEEIFLRTNVYFNILVSSFHLVFFLFISVLTLIFTLNLCTCDISRKKIIIYISFTS